jgi:hypothetical protein
MVLFVDVTFCQLVYFTKSLLVIFFSVYHMIKLYLHVALFPIHPHFYHSPTTPCCFKRILFFFVHRMISHYIAILNTTNIFLFLTPLVLRTLDNEQKKKMNIYFRWVKYLFNLVERISSEYDK